jgi:tetratricopeptide (TPR) repeat protein
MQSHDSSKGNDSSGDAAASGRTPVSPAVRKRLQQCFACASKQASTNNFDYATDLFSECVLGDKNNRVYWESFLGNLRKKYDNNKKGVKLAAIRTGTQRATVKKCQLRKDYDGVFRHGLAVLKLNPWDVSTLMAMAAAGEALELDDTPVVLLDMALMAAPKDTDLNRAAGRILRARRRYDQARACWLRVLEARKDDDEARKQLSELETEKVIHKGGYEGAESSRDVQVEEPQAQATPRAAAQAEQAPERALERAIRNNPSDTGPYVELAELFCHREDYDKAIQVLTRAYDVAGKDGEILERLQDAQLRGLRKKLRELEAQYKKTGDAQAKQEWKSVREQFDRISLERIKHLAERYPNDLGYEFQLGEAYQRVGEYKEAIAHYQKGRNDPRRKGECLLRLGQCFWHIKQAKLAATNLDAALVEISGQDPDLLKEALYYAGKMAMEMKDLDKAEGHLTQLAGLDFGYKDVSALLDKVAELRNTE